MFSRLAHSTQQRDAKEYYQIIYIALSGFHREKRTLSKTKSAPVSHVIWADGY